MGLYPRKTIVLIAHRAAARRVWTLTDGEWGVKSPKEEGGD